MIRNEQLKVRQLIELLALAPQDMPVKTEGAQCWGDCTGVSYSSDGRFVQIRRDDGCDHDDDYDVNMRRDDCLYRR